MKMLSSAGAGNVQTGTPAPSLDMIRQQVDELNCLASQLLLRTVAIAEFTTGRQVATASGPPEAPPSAGIVPQTVEKLDEVISTIRRVLSIVDAIEIVTSVPLPKAAQVVGH